MKKVFPGTCLLPALAALALLAPAPAQKKTSPFGTNTIRTLARKLNDYVEPFLEWNLTTNARKKIKLGGDWRENLAKFRKELAKQERRARTSIMKELDALRSLNRQAFNYTRNPTKAGGYFLKQFEIKLENQTRRFKFGYFMPKQYRYITRSKKGIPLIISLAARNPNSGNWQQTNRHLKELYGGSTFEEDHLMLSPQLPDKIDMSKEPEAIADFQEWTAPIATTLEEFWKCHQIDWNRIYLEGNGESCRLAAYLAAVKPRLFAGVILRNPPKLEKLKLENFHHLPLLVLEDKQHAGNHASLQEALKKLDRKKIALGGGREIDALTVVDDPGDYPFTKANKAIRTWIDTVERKPSPTHLCFRPVFSEMREHWLIKINRFITYVENATASYYPLIEVEMDREKNEIEIKSQCVKSFNLFLNDELVDLDKPIKLKVNGQVKEIRVERKLDLAIWPALLNDPEFVRTAMIGNIQPPEDEKGKKEE